MTAVWKQLLTQPPSGEECKEQSPQSHYMFSAALLVLPCFCTQRKSLGHPHCCEGYPATSHRNPSLCHCKATELFFQWVIDEQLGQRGPGLSSALPWVTVIPVGHDINNKLFL